MSSKTLIIPAAGSGSRLKRKIPKPFLKLNERTILEHTLRRFLSLEELHRVVVSTTGSYRARAEGILEKTLPADISGSCVIGGSERQHSIHNALQEAGESDLVIVHDAVRPFVTAAQIEACCRAASETGAAVLGVPAKNTVKRVDRNLLVRETPDRRFLWQTQTPQVFQMKILLEAYTRAFEDDYTGTDDSSLVERAGYSVKMVEGDHNNFKITYPLDLRLAQLLINKEQPTDE